MEVEELGSDIEEDQQVHRNPMDPGNLAAQIIVGRPVSTWPPETSEQLSPEDSGSLQSQVEEESIGGLVTGDLLEDAKFYQNVAVELQTAYDTFQKRFAQQSRLMEEASGALHAAESQASQRHGSCLRCKGTMKLVYGRKPGNPQAGRTCRVDGWSCMWLCRFIAGWSMNASIWYHPRPK